MTAKNLLEGFDKITPREWDQRIAGAAIAAIPFVGGSLSVLLAPPGQTGAEKSIICIGSYDCTTMKGNGKGVSSFIDIGVGEVEVCFTQPVAEDYYVFVSPNGLLADCYSRSPKGFRIKLLSPYEQLMDGAICFAAVRV
ncbi:hypothetical protein MHY87_02580 [Microvirga sp. ACRRW]|uniref:hypothetical protein n=1 Tax=Microvirga sp. ACRRW TaxID=2918205 RepID=UPI001EF65D34|nr:hypothetical protein [Microvirga sp. ACRRW]MCG7391792.1 hypothetical protein [Microvirga sp. ACRRW]